MAGKLDPYRRKRHFDATPEPEGTRRRRAPADAQPAERGRHPLRYVIQEHHARRLHYDFRLELDGTLKSWAVPKGPSFDPSVKRLAVHVEDHPLEYASFEGEIPAGHYGAGSVIVWDEGTWTPEGGLAKAREGYRAGKLKFRLDGEKLHGGWALVRSGRQEGRQEQWLLIKERDDDARSAEAYDVVAQQPGSVHDGATRGRAANGHAANGHARARRRGEKAAGKEPDAEADADTDAPRARATKAKRPPALSRVEGAVRAPLPERVAPQLATLVDAPPAHGDWRYELKFDGYRMLARIAGKGARRRVTLMTREGRDWTPKLRALRDALAALEVDDAWLDGEAVVLGENGLPDFQLLQNALGSGQSDAVTLFVFDLPYLNGYDLRDAPLTARRAQLEPLFDAADPARLRFSPDLGSDAAGLIANACDTGLEGLIGKRADARYRAGRSPAWIKLKCRRRQEFVIGGYTEPTGSRHGFGALLLGVHDPAPNGKRTRGASPLRYVGRVGTGFDTRMLDKLAPLLREHERASSPFDPPPQGWSRTRVHWVEPTLVAECEFAEWTGDGIVRQAAFVALREDKPASQIVREVARHPTTENTMDERTSSSARRGRAAADTHDGGQDRAQHRAQERAPAARGKSAPDQVGQVRITHPERVLDRESGTRKIDLAHYWERVAPWALPDLAGRPVSLVRAPQDIGGELFFQKHAERREIPFVTQHPGLDPGHGPLLSIDSVDALIGAAQMGTIELHTWNAHTSNIERPDRIVFDLDPDPALPWRTMIEAAQLVRGLLDELGLVSFCKTSGGKGLHVVVPITRHSGWDEMKDFSRAVAQHIAGALPDRFTATMGPRHRRGKIFIDYLRNGRGASTIAAYSVRARPGMGVSVPIDWDEVPATTGGAQWTIDTVHERLDALERDPWEAYADTRQRITAAMRTRLAAR
ncbi:DNA ligase D [Burkholderia multivorans]|uniref:DNA ligase D n=1 Tax=Burkholderia multivorans TaxID=87883 RepID=UPI0019CFA972|nr:DNA ligase D [Burkholderia multivorans]MBN6733085.1 DNA ligase D [Burkholderia multivorans]MBN6738626.1 DNA ligase D [Burkholderia multivorans]MBN7128524.1 DNA ligase D [Burkholderia multivorans]MBN8167388.1 DNA ligase D [Burkholderia multivorans]MBN8173181.1 DNA ligase D [Burkholderia multivorans]